MKNNMITKPEAIIFDFDDTLVNSKPIIHKALAKTFQHFNIPETDFNNSNFNRSLRDYFKEIFADKIETARDIYYKHYFDFAKDLKAFEYAQDVLDYLYQNKVYTVIVSNKNGPRLRYEINDHFRWSKYFKQIIGAGDFEADKPSPISAEHSLKELALDNHSNVWLIGDSVVDLQTAQNLGCKGILFGNSSPKEVPFYHSVENHQQLLELLKGLYA
jgi:phosphoglycolate phosphatase